MTKPLILDSLEIRQFRAFRHLRVERLGRVNLVTGRNNVGKSCLLEALWLYAHRGSPSVIWQLLEARDESSRPPIRSERDTEERALAIKYLFYGRKDIREEPLEPIKIGSVNSQADLLSIDVGWATWSTDEGGRREFQLLQPKDYHTVETPVTILVIQFGAQEKIVQRFDWRGVRPPKLKEIPCVFVSANGLEALQIGQLWDAVALTNLEENVLTSLRIIAPEAERVNLVGEPEGRRRRIPIVKIAGFDSPMPLRSMGEGMNRLFGITLALVNAQDGMLLIDELDSGLYYSVQPDLWRLIFQVARRLNVQVFATTHSWDCVEAFQQAVQENGQGEGLLISLRDKKDEKGRVVAVLFDEHELGIVTREQIEVR